ncbi:MAG: hypothetical protein J0L70_06700 [Leptolyngbya sp. UWPOB_LEPTO1]|uniref:transposase family protein n=1 Tax=Leptolyngbya sp. UWPOB_LEPTO1 TaxID=2815653 RepID=UPI001ACFAE88|nr:transposase family protein [Leptolyngbya sp. UWPOB_LEPTO1]MBN8560191.1 hypothetical protein [Leptolyngbya sp. UWPOB_LEPTO1]
MLNYQSLQNKPHVFQSLIGTSLYKFEQSTSILHSNALLVVQTYKINRPQDKEKRKKYYGSKQKAHAVKNKVIAKRQGKMKCLSDIYKGKRHDLTIADQEKYKFPAGSRCGLHNFRRYFFR